MSLQHIPIISISESDLLRLINDQVPESKHLDYKRDFCLVTDEQKREFLCDVTAMANTDGGDLLYGMREDAGIAKELVGLKNFIADSSLGTIENLLRDFVQPRLKGHRPRVVDLKNGNHALILRVPRSFTAPHMVFHKGLTRFCGRNSNGKYDLDVQELRSAFVDNEAMGERLKTFRLDRISRLISGDAPRPMYGDPLIVLHVLMLQGAISNYQVDHDKLVKLSRHDVFYEFNFDGIRNERIDSQDKTLGYTQVYRNGFFEVVNAKFLHPDYLDPRYSKNGRGYIMNILWENMMIQYYEQIAKLLAVLQCSPPYAVSLSLLNVRGYAMFVGNGCEGDRSHPIDQDHLLTREILVDSEERLADQVLKPLFDQIWNACGYPGSEGYNPDGTRKSNRY
ncbi:MAG: ATP-binding protein [Verrucomicrobia bacterium]|nr:ATP-binding protein [Verrucomicrobiota bacterium]MCH8511543.1 ATP-binding protein [Kiritimatiellia bacterium]